MLIWILNWCIPHFAATSQGWIMKWQKTAVLRTATRDWLKPSFKLMLKCPTLQQKQTCLQPGTKNSFGLYSSPFLTTAKKDFFPFYHLTHINDAVFRIWYVACLGSCWFWATSECRHRWLAQQSLPRWHRVGTSHWASQLLFRNLWVTSQRLRPHFIHTVKKRNCCFYSKILAAVVARISP